MFRQNHEMKLLILPALSTLWMLTPAIQNELLRFDEATWKAEVESERKSRDEEFRSREWSALAVVAIAPLDHPRMVIGSGADADLRLEGKGVASAHAEVLREPGVARNPTFRVRALGGRLSWAEARAEASRESPLAENVRVRIGPFQVYWSRLSTFGPVIRALDFSSPAYTQFDGLRYFPPDSSYRVVAQVTPYAEVERVLIGDTQGWQRPAWRYGEAAFSLRGRQLRLVLLVFLSEPSEKDTFFVAFSDATSGRETYPATRYLMPRFVRSGPMVLDFNRATNPLCAYNTGFACPLPPRENRIPLDIRAGEKIYPHAARSH